jgi:hypothetical protein
LRTGDNPATALLTSLRMFFLPERTVARRWVMVDKILALVEPAAVGELTGLRRRRAEPVAVAAPVAAAVAVAEPVAVMPGSETPLMVSPMFP